METKKNILFETVMKYKALLLCLALTVTFTYIIRNDYVAADAYIEPSDTYIFVTEDNPVQIKINASSKMINSVLFSMQNPEISSEAVTTIGLYDGEKAIAMIDLPHNENCEVTDSLGNATEIFWDQEVKVNTNKEYTIQISSNAENSQYAFGFRLNQNGTVWTRMTYFICSASERKHFFTCAVIFLIILFYVIWKRKEYFAKPDNFFLLASFMLCPLYLLCVPIFQVPDEVNHFVRAYGIVHGYFLSPEGGNIPIPANLIPYEWYTYTPYILLKNFKMNINPTEGIIHNNVNMALYSPVSYVFQVFGIGIADLFSNNSHVLVLAGSIANMVGCTALLYYAIKFIPYGKWVIAFISLLPMSLQERASLSVDAVTYAALVAILSFCLYMRQKEGKMSQKEMGIMYLLIALVASCKVVYFPAAFLIFLIPGERFVSKRKERMHKMLGCMETVFLSIGWLAVAGNYLGNTRGGGDAAEKIKFIIQSPGRYLYILDKTFWEDEGKLIGEMLGTKLGSLNICVNLMLILFIMLLFFKIYYKEKERRAHADYLAEIFMIFVNFIIIMLIAASLYIQWTDINASTYAIEGLQGRYFLPVLPLIVCAFLSEKKNTIQVKNGGEGNTLFGLYVINLLVLINVISYSSYIG